MTKFNKEDFTWDGMYLMYRGKHTQSVNMEVANPKCHPSWVGSSMVTNLGKHGLTS
jgi:ribosomal protein L31